MQALEKLITGQLSKSIVEHTRPVFSYPVLARYSGKGDPKQADSFVPFDPSNTERRLRHERTACTELIQDVLSTNKK